RFRFFKDAVVKNRRRARSLKSNHHWQFCRSSMRTILPVSCPIRSDVSGVADGQQMKIWRIAQFICNLKRRGFLSRDPVRVDRVYNGQIAGLAELAHDSQRIIEIAVD